MQIDWAGPLPSTARDDGSVSGQWMLVKNKTLDVQELQSGARSLWGEESFLPQSKARRGNRQGGGSVVETPATRW